MPIDDEFGSDHDVENRRRRRRVDFDDDCFSHEPDSFYEGQSHSMEKEGTPNYERVIGEPPVKRYFRERVFGTGTSDADKEADKPHEEQYRGRKSCYQC